jgi:hypothetical protein
MQYMGSNSDIAFERIPGKGATRAGFSGSNGF